MNITVSMPNAFVAKLKQAAKESGLTYSELLRRAFDYYMERPK